MAVENILVAKLEIEFRTAPLDNEARLTIFCGTWKKRNRSGVSPDKG